MASVNSLRKQTELTTGATLHASEARYRTLATVAPVGIFHTDAQGLLTYVNEKWCEIGGMTAEAAMGTGWLAAVHPEDRESIAAKWDAFARNQTTYDTEYRYQRPDGTTAYCYVQALPEIDDDGNLVGYIGCVTDISDRKRVEEALRESNERYARTVAGTNDGIWEWDVQTGDNYFSPRWKAILGYGEDELVHHVDTFFDHVHPDDLAMVYEVNRAHFEEKKPNDVELRMRHKDGHYVWIHERGHTIRSDDGKPLLMSGSITDITERKRLEEKLVHAQRMEAVGQLTGGLAHDFNNLMAIMLGNAELLADSVVEDEEAKLSIDAIKVAVNRGASLINRLLSFSRKQMLSPATTDVTALIGSLLDMLHQTLGESIDLSVDGTPALWLAKIDKHQFENALINLALNARDAMPQGGTLKIETANVTLNETYAEQNEEVMPGHYVQVAVSDTGTGISPEVLEKVFEPFFTTKEVGKGSGLGLSMVYGFAKQSKGHITIYSEVGHGTTVNLYMPRAEKDLVQEGAKDDTREFAPGSERILVVEDDENVRRDPVTILRDQGYEVVEAGDGREAIERLRDGEPFDLLFTDIVLPGGMNGVEIAEQAKRIQPNIKVIFTTGYAETAIAHKGQLEPGAALLNKPYRREELLDKVRALLDSGDD